MRQWYRNLRLNTRFTLVLSAVFLLPISLLAYLLLSNVQALVIRDKVQDLEESLLELKGSVDKAVELCNMTTQVFLNSPNLHDYLEHARDGTPYGGEELVAFYSNDVASFERLVTSNPYLYEVRVYYDNPSVPEVMPLLYTRERMQRLAWAQEEWTSGTWQFDYSDTLFMEEVRTPTPHIMSLVTVIESMDARPIGILEVAIRMDELMPSLFTSDEGTYGAFVETSGAWHFGPEAEPFWQENRDTLARQLDLASGTMESTTLNLAGEDVWLATLPLPALGGNYVTVVSLGSITDELAATRNLFLLGTLVVLAALALAVNQLSKAMLRRLYVVFSAMTQVEAGDLSVTVPDLGSDEVGMLGLRLNRMLERIHQLMQENIDRQLLAKHSQILALQSQINAHFIYNVLESIKMMAEVEERYDISDAVTSLGQLLRYSMHWNTQDVTLAQEMEHLHNYLALINLRYDYQITLRTQLNPGMLSQRLPKLTLQPVVENAVVHGIEDLAQDSFIDITAENREDGFYLIVTDYGKGMAPDELAALRTRLAGKIETGPREEGIGLKNVQDRIVMAFGAEYGLSVDVQPGHHTKVIIHLPHAQTPEEAL